MKLFKYYQFINESNQDIDSICKKYGIKNYTINDDGSIDVNGSVNLNNKGLTKLPLKFKNVSGDFFCHKNQLTTLEGAPDSVGGNFNCFNNQLATLEGAPTSVGGDFICYDNKLVSLEGSPDSVGRNFYSHNNQLVSLEGVPTSVGGNFWCYNNQLKDVYGIKEGYKIKGYFIVDDNPVFEIFKLFPEDQRVEAIEYLNEYEVIRGNKVILQALEMVFVELNLDVPEIEYIKGYEII